MVASRREFSQNFSLLHTHTHKIQHVPGNEARPSTSSPNLQGYGKVHCLLTDPRTVGLLQLIPVSSVGYKSEQAPMYSELPPCKT